MLENVLNTITEPNLRMMKIMLGLEHGVIAYIIAKNNIIEMLEEHGPLTTEQIAQKITDFNLTNIELF